VKDLDKNNYSEDKTISYAEYCKMKEFFIEQLAEKEKIIAEMKVRNAILLKSALKQSEKNLDLGNKSKAILELNRELEEKAKKT
jgi:hypothetical protein